MRPILDRGCFSHELYVVSWRVRVRYRMGEGILLERRIGAPKFLVSEPEPVRMSRLLLILAVLIASITQSAGQLDPRAPWPMPGANVGRTGQATVSGPVVGPGTTIGLKWAFDPPSFPKIALYYDSPLSIAANGNVYANAGTGTVYCINATTGLEVWSSVLQANFPATGTAIGTAAVFSASKGMSLYAINATSWTRRNGSQLWAVATSTNGYSVSSPLLRPDNVLVVGAGDGSVHAVDPVTGMRVWNSTLPTAPHGGALPGRIRH